ncbi:hypothetical protein RJ640_011194 [Escallonia rubra]|uniref:rRNA adenine N(6)-methyltransferase n=1 Tax=Escallonia rubra TaxID=112253 RepID=A0AA88S1W1_9ASTE|nr:hypothetical protein RJ640_011194 [Escallonia rubra]
MLQRPKFISIHVFRFILRQQTYHIHQLRPKSSRPYYNRHDDEEDERIRKRKENPEGHLHLFKSKGQHLLTNQRVLDTIVRKSDIKPTDTVLEIGPGTGNLTVKLLEVARKVVAVEIDKRMVEVLQNRVKASAFEDRLTVLCKDALKTEFPHFDLVVANIPYGISSPLVAKLVFGVNPYRSATLLLQKEFARRLLANPGDSDFNRLAVNVKLVAEVEFVRDVSKRDFSPCPKVDSSVVIIRPKAEIPDVDFGEWCAFTKTCFSKKNKTLGATFKQKKKVMELFKLSEGIGSKEDSAVRLHDCYPSGDGNVEVEMRTDVLETGASLFKDKLVGILKSGGFEDKRPSKLSNEDLLHLLSLFNQAGIHFHDRAKPGDASITACFVE